MHRPQVGRIVDPPSTTPGAAQHDLSGATSLEPASRPCPPARGLCRTRSFPQRPGLRRTFPDRLMDEAMNFRKARTEDIPQIDLFIVRSIKMLHVEHYSPAEIEAAIRLAYGVDWQLIRDQTYYVADVDGVVAGAGGWSFRRTIGGGHGPDEPASPSLHPQNDAARIRAFYVDPRYARRGIGSQLLSICESAARNAGFSRVELTSTLQAVPFYLTHGYDVVGPINLPYAEGFMLRTELMSKSI